MTIVFDGRGFAGKKLLDIKKKFRVIRETSDKIPCLASIYFPEDPASVIYTKLKKKAAKALGAEFLDYTFTRKDISAVIALIKVLNCDTSVHGIMVQKPVGRNFFGEGEWEKMISVINRKKDVDGLTESSCFVPATVKAVLEILDQALNSVRWPFKVEPLKICVVGARGMVGKALVREFGGRQSVISGQKFEVVGYHSQTPDLASLTKQADVLISATGKTNLITGEMVKTGAIMIDVGSPKGDCDFESVKQKAAFITPVPGGVGPTTIICLLENLLLAAGREV